MLKLSLLLAVLTVSCTRTADPVPVVTHETGEFSQAITGGATVDGYGWSFVAIGSSPANSRSVTVNTLGPDRILTAIGEMENSNVTMTISDTAGLAWQLIGTWAQSETNVNEGTSFFSMWAAQAPNVSTDTVTVHFSQTAGCALGVIATANSGMPQGFIHGSDPTTPAPQFTMNASPGSILFGGASDVSGDCCFAWSALSGTTLKGGDGYAANDYGVFWTSTSVAGGASTFGTNKAVTGFVDWGGIAAEIPMAGTLPPPPPVDAGTPDAGPPDAGPPADAGTCSWVCQ